MFDDTTPASRMFQMITGYWITQIVHGAAVAGYAERLHEGPATADELAAGAGLDASAVFRHLRACVSLGLATFDGQRFTTTPMLDILRRDHPQSLRGFALSQPAPGHWLPWGRFSEVLRSGQHQTVAALGSPLFDYYARTPTEADAFTEAMAGLSAGIASEAGRILDTRGDEHVVDVGGAGGALLVPLLQANLSLRGTLLDLPNIIETISFSQLPHAVRSRLDKVGGDFFESVPPADLYLLKWILHDWNDEECVAILKNCRKAISAGGRVAIFELVLGEGGAADVGPLMDLNMLVMLTGRERTLAEYGDLLAKAGFGEVALTRTATPLSMIVARPID
jgi:hypothetical protein